MLLALFAFLAGLVTILSPCILPLLPIVLSSGVTGGKSKPLGVVSGFVLSFSFFTLFLATIVQLTNLSADALRNLAAIIILVFGLVLVVPALQLKWELLAARMVGRGGKKIGGNGFWGGMAVGVSLGLVWAPCVGPILASVITLAAVGKVGLATILIVLAYSMGTAVPMLAIVLGSRKLIAQLPQLRQKLPKIQQGFGVLMVATALMIYFGWDRRFQGWVLDKLPNYGSGLTRFEDRDLIEQKLKELSGTGSANPVDLAPELIGGGTWLNSEPLTIEQLNSEGKVVLVDFWTYSCVNCIRTMPYLKAWHEKYADKGLVIIGVHSPEFEFEKLTKNVEAAIDDFAISYPVVQDNDFLIWRAYENRYWPAKYLIDKQGQIRYRHFGEGKYQETESKIQELLGETADLTSFDEVKNQARTPETYLGSLRAIPNNPIYSLEGNWKVDKEYAQADKGNKLLLKFEAKEVNVVMSPVGGVGLVKVSVGGKSAVVEVNGDKLYNLIKTEAPYRGSLEIEILEGNIRVYAFTFG